MQFSALLLKTLPVCFPISLGFFAGRRWPIDQRRLAQIVYYFFSPAVIFWAVADTPLSAGILSLPLIVLAIGSLNCLLTFGLAGWWWKDRSRNALAMAVGTSNAGYFGLPIAQALFDDRGLSIYVVSILGIILYENLTAFYVSARSEYSVKESVRRVLLLPTVHASWLGVLASFYSPQLMQPLAALKQPFFLIYAFFGMSIVGFGLARVRSLSFDYRFISAGLVAKFLCWPLWTVAVLWLDAATFHILPSECDAALLLIAQMPIAANTVLLASLFNSQPDKVATVVVLSTGIALFYVPWVVSWLI